jgi:hypothetical protein
VLGLGRHSAAVGFGLNGWLLRVRSFLNTGRFNPLLRHQVHLTDARELELRLSPSSLELVADIRAEPYRVQLTGNTVTPAAASESLSVTLQNTGSQDWQTTTAELIEQVSGAGTVDWLEQRVSSWSDAVRRKRHAWLQQSGPRPVLAVPAASAAARSFTWPPPPLAPLLAPSLPGEGEWQAAGIPRDVNSTPLFYQTFLRGDIERSYSRLTLVALDMRRLALRMEAGYDEPRPLAGPPGAGALPEDAATRERVVATFNGALKSRHAANGMMVNKRVLVPPRPAAASVVVREDSRAGLGNFGATTETLPWLRSFRQSLGALVVDGRPSVQLEHAADAESSGSALTERSALCRRRDGNWLYAWGQDLTATKLAEILAQVGCDYAIQLDMNPGHAGLVYTAGLELGLGQARLKLADPGMTLPPQRHIAGSSQDFFYLLERAPEAQQLAALNPAITWSPSAGLNPPPESLPAIFQAVSERAGVAVQLYSVQPGRLRFELTGGQLEPLRVGAPSPVRTLAEATRSEVAIGFGLGHTTLATRYGLVSAGEPSVSPRRLYATLILGKDSALRIEPSGTLPTLLPGESAVQLPELVREGEMTERLTDRGESILRGALCVHPDGRLLVATAAHDGSYPVGVELARLGCRTVLQMDRGSKHPVVVQRGPAPELGESSEITWLYGSVQPMQPLTFGLQ